MDKARRVPVRCKAECHLGGVVFARCILRAGHKGEHLKLKGGRLKVNFTMDSMEEIVRPRKDGEKI